jgi:transcription-repair coupling factor (superfamily II helicase)
MQGQRRVAVRPVRIDARIDAYVPQQYVSSEALRIDIHRRLALSETEDELRELQAALEDRYGPLPEPVEHLFAIQEAKIKVARLGADYLVFRGGKATVGRLVLGSEELKELRARIHTAVYTVGAREVSLRSEDGFPQALRLVDAILEARQAA